MRLPFAVLAGAGTQIPSAGLQFKHALQPLLDLLKANCSHRVHGCGLVFAGAVAEGVLGIGNDPSPMLAVNRKERDGQKTPSVSPRYGVPVLRTRYAGISYL